MPKPKNRVPLLGSERAPLPGARVSGRLDPDERVSVTVIIHARHPPQDSTVSEFGAPLPHRRPYLTREEFDAAHGASRGDLAKVEAFAQEYALDVVEEDPARRTVVLSGTIAQLCRAFDVKLVRYKHPKGIYRGRSGPIYLPAALAPVVQAVLGLDERPQAKSHFRILRERAAAGGASHTPPQVAELYDYPSGLDGEGQSVAIIELGGGYTTKDLTAYFSGLGIPMPSVLSISVDGSSNSPTGDPNGSDAEVMLDIEVIGSIAPKAEIYVYFAPNTDAGFVDAVSSAVHDSQHKPSIVSISWGDAEVNWTMQGMQALNDAFQEAAMLGVTICAASGDGGSSDGATDGLAHVDFPASSQYVLGCGGTRLVSSGKTIKSEVAWNDQPTGGATGGGVSDVFPLPAWQSNARVPPSANPGAHVGRGVPDVSGDAAPSTGYAVRVDGKKITIGGTSAVAPLWTGLIALINQRLGKPAGYLNPLLYGLPASGELRDITSGNNGAYSTGPGWDPCTGLGSPDGTELAALL